MDRDVRPSGLAPELPVAALIASAALPLVGRIYRPGRAGSVMLVTVAAVCGLRWLLRRVRAPGAVQALASGLAFFWLASAIFYRDAMAGPFPSPDSVSQVLRDLERAADVARIEPSPVPATVPLLLLLSAFVWATGWGVHNAAVGLRRPLLAIGLSLPLYFSPGVAAPDLHRLRDVWPFLGAALWLLYGDERRRLARWAAARGGRPGGTLVPAVGLGAATCAAALGVTALVPPLGAGAAQQGPRVAYNPIVSIRATLTRDPPIELFRVRTQRAAYYRLTSLDTFDGNVWTQTPEPASLVLDRGPLRPEVSGRTRPIRQRVTVSGLGGPWIPAAYAPVDLRGIAGVRAQPTTLAMLHPSELRPGIRYSVRSEAPEPRRTDLTRPAELGRGIARYTKLSFSVPKEVSRTARTVAGGYRTPYGKTVALQRFFRSRFTYDERVAAGHRIESLIDFLRVRRGYCEQFAGTMAVMARSLGLPARVAVGFTAGERIGDDVFRVTTRHAHAWPEIFFAGVGWLAFEPTPRAGFAHPPPYTLPASGEREERQPAAESPGATPTTRPQPTEAAAEHRPERAGRDGGGAGARRVALTVVLVAAAAAAPKTWALARRARRRRRVSDPGDAVAVRYREFLEWCAAAGFGRAPAETPAEHAERLAGIARNAGPPARELAALAARALWAPRNGLDPSDAERLATQTRRALGDAVGRGRRILAASGVVPPRA